MARISLLLSCLVAAAIIGGALAQVRLWDSQECVMPIERQVSSIQGVQNGGSPIGIPSRDFAF